MSHLLVVTVDGYGKRVPLADIPRRRRKTKGVKVSTAPVAAALMLDGPASIVIATSCGKITRIAADDIPVRRRTVGKGGRMAKGARIVRVEGGDRVTAVGIDLPTLPEA
jgi:DNA gyrase/topoisomerase IV subunit A